MAEIFLASCPDYSRPVVVKRILPHFNNETEFLKMFLNEARIAAHLHHPGIVNILDLGQYNGQLYLAMEYIDGYDLGKLTDAAGERIPPFIAAHIAADLSDALFYANQACDRNGTPLNVIHRDVNPGNVMIDRTGTVKLVDFGVAKAEAQLEKTCPGVVKGKFRYMSPEQLHFTPLDGRSDLFSLGVLLYEVTTGQIPFDGSQIIDVALAVTGWNPPPPIEIIPNFPQSISDIIMKAIRKDRDLRFSNGKEMKNALESAIAASGKVISKAEIGEFVCELEKKYYEKLNANDSKIPMTLQSFRPKENTPKPKPKPKTVPSPSSFAPSPLSPTDEMQPTKRIRFFSETSGPPNFTDSQPPKKDLALSAPPSKNKLPQHAMVILIIAAIIGFSLIWWYLH